MYAIVVTCFIAYQIPVTEILRPLSYSKCLTSKFCLYLLAKVIQSRRMRWAGHVARTEEGIGVYRVLVGRPKGKRPRERPRRRWENNIKIDLGEIGIDGANWICLVQDRVRWRAFLNTVMNLRVP
jgi:hypothetical protein